MAVIGAHAIRSSCHCLPSSIASVQRAAPPAMRINRPVAIAAAMCTAAVLDASKLPLSSSNSEATLQTDERRRVDEPYFSFLMRPTDSGLRKDKPIRETALSFQKAGLPVTPRKDAASNTASNRELKFARLAGENDTDSDSSQGEDISTFVGAPPENLWNSKGFH